MYKIAKLPIEERETLFRNTARKMQVAEAIVEKDFWVCFTLDYLFYKNRWHDSFAFKGGTSLSKAYNIIERFSEDIDLILDWRILGYEKDEPLLIPSNNKRGKFVLESRNRLFSFLKNEFTPVFKKDIEEILGRKINIYVDPNDDGVVNFEYPASFSDDSILNVIRLEIGALAAWTPTHMETIRTYVYDYYPQIFEKGDTTILTTTLERTFWEKATILHQEAQRAEDSKVPSRYSRHYYDLYCMVKKGVLDSAINDEELLIKVAEFKRKFYPRSWAHYELARIGTLKLYPAESSISDLRKDYESMQKMIYGESPSFDDLLKFIKETEEHINKKNVI